MPNGKTYDRVYRMRVMYRGKSRDGQGTLTMTIPRKLAKQFNIKGGDIVLVRQWRGKTIVVKTLEHATAIDQQNMKRQLFETDFVEVEHPEDIKRREKAAAKKSFKQKVHAGEEFQYWKPGRKKKEKEK